MSNYIGVKCPVCSKKFIQTDDIVVCPVCGAPHHRECYAENAACAFAADHINGMEWHAPQVEQPQSNGSNSGGSPFFLICPSCNNKNPNNVFFCGSCGKRLSEAVPPARQAVYGHTFGIPSGFGVEINPVSLMYGGLSPDEKIENESVKDLAIYIGENSAYYLPKFKLMAETSRTLTFNFSALIFGFLYFLHRKMYVIGLILLALYVIGAIPSVLQFYEMMPEFLYLLNLTSEATVNQAAIEHYNSLINITGTINFFIGLIISFCANRFYYMKALSDVKKIRESRQNTNDEKTYGKALAARGGVSKPAVIIALFAIFTACFIIYGIMMSSFYMGGL